jgi:orotate phosphoribosyltransferase
VIEHTDDGPFADRLPSRDQRLHELALDVLNAAYLRGDYMLSSGVRSGYFFDKYLFETKPGILRRVAAFLAELVPDDVERIAGPELGGVPLATALSLETGLPFVIIKREPRDHGSSPAVEGELYAGETVVLVEDVLTTGSSAVAAARKLRSNDAVVKKVIAVIDREEGASLHLAGAGLETEALYRLSDLRAP